MKYFIILKNEQGETFINIPLVKKLHPQSTTEFYFKGKCYTYMKTEYMAEEVKDVGESIMVVTSVTYVFGKGN